MHFEILGPLRVVASSGKPVPLARGRIRQLLKVLLLVGEPTSEDRLCDWLSDRGRPMGGSTLRTHITALRRQLRSEGYRMLSTSEGYLIVTYPGEVDLQIFRECAAQGSSALLANDNVAAARLLEQAFALCREPLLADFPDSVALSSHRMELLEYTRLVAEQLMEARMRLHRHREAVAGLRALAETDPPNEHTYGQLMLALYRSGRRAEATQAFLILRKRLAESFGLDPGPAITDLYHRILADAPDLHMS